MSDRFSMPDLKPAVCTTDIAPDEDLGAALGRVRRLGANVYQELKFLMLQLLLHRLLLHFQPY